MKRKILESILDGIAVFWRFIPWKLRNYFFLIPILLEGRGNHIKAFKRLFEIEDNLKWVYNELALRHGNGVHIKHNLMNYYYFFESNIKKNHNVLDIGCGYGAVAISIAKNMKQIKVTGIDIDKEKINKAIQNNNVKNLKFIHGDAFEIKPFKVDVIILSNVLEHIENREDFIIRIKKIFNPSLFLIRVPDFERDWTIPFRKQIGTNYFSDSTHYIEHTEKEFRNEMDHSGLQVISLTKNWSEIWAICENKVE